MKEVLKWTLIVGASGFALNFVIGYVAAKQQGSSAPVLPGWYTGTLGKLDSLGPGPGLFADAAIAGGLGLLALKLI